MEDKEPKDGKVSCAICGKRFKIITPRHLKQHRMSLADYKRKYPNSPISGSQFSASTKYAHADVFTEDKKTEEITTPNGTVDYDKMMSDIDEDGVIVEDNSFPEIEEMTTREVNFEPVPEDRMGREKITILNLLRSYYPKVQKDFFIRKFTLSNQLDYEYISDFADPIAKVLFDFPKMFWHNDYITNKIRNVKLQKEGWKIFTFTISSMNLEKVKNQLEKLY